LGEQATLELYECEHLTVGKLAPEIQGEDIDEHRLKLSDDRGKVVVISFWASWCGPCMQMVPHERVIAERLAGKPFVLIGVNGDSKRTDAKRAVTEQNMTGSLSGMMEVLRVESPKPGTCMAGRRPTFWIRKERFV
jgi:thiol-disulfide isomerase/thioredoxin